MCALKILEVQSIHMQPPCWLARRVVQFKFVGSIDMPFLNLLEALGWVVKQPSKIPRV